jgi:hypothetical protein
MSLGVLTANVVLGRLCLILFSRSILDLGLMLAPAVTSSLHSKDSPGRSCLSDIELNIYRTQTKRRAATTFSGVDMLRVEHMLHDNLGPIDALFEDIVEPKP